MAVMPLSLRGKPRRYFYRLLFAIVLAGLIPSAVLLMNYSIWYSSNMCEAFNNTLYSSGFSFGKALQIGEGESVDSLVAKLGYPLFVAFGGLVNNNRRVLATVCLNSSGVPIPSDMVLNRRADLESLGNLETVRELLGRECPELDYESWGYSRSVNGLGNPYIEVYFMIDTREKKIRKRVITLFTD